MRRPYVRQQIETKVHGTPPTPSQSKFGLVEPLRIKQGRSELASVHLHSKIGGLGPANLEPDQQSISNDTASRRIQTGVLFEADLLSDSKEYAGYKEATAPFSGTRRPLSH